MTIKSRSTKDNVGSSLDIEFSYETLVRTLKFGKYDLYFSFGDDEVISENVIKRKNNGIRWLS